MTAVNTLAAIGPDLSEMPRFDDGMVNIRELIRTMAEALVNEIMDAQAEDACADGNQRNGYRDRALVTSVGVINLRIPKLRRGSYFPEDLLVRYSRVDRAVIAAVSEMVTCGVSTRKVEKVASALGVDRMSASQVSRICESLDAAVADLQERDLSGVAFPYVWVDATYLKCRDAGHVSSCALVTAIGAGSDGVSATAKSAERATLSRRRRPRFPAGGATALWPPALPRAAAQGALDRGVVEVRGPDLNLQRRGALGVPGRDRPARDLPSAELREPDRHRDVLCAERGQPPRGVRGPHDCPLSGSPSPSAASASRSFMR